MRAKSFLAKVVALLLFITWGCITFASENLMGIISRETAYDEAGPLPEFNKQDNMWLLKKKKLILAVPLPDNPPMDITMRGNIYEGVTADIIGLLSKKLNVEIQAKIFNSRDLAIAAVKNGDADFIGSANSYEEKEGLLLSKPYIDDEPAIYKNINIKSNEIRKVAVADSYLSYSDLISYFPGGKIKFYPSRYSAVAAAAYGDVDAVLIDMISGNFLVNKFYQDKVQLTSPLYVETGGFSFGLEKNNIRLARILNNTLMSISAIHKESIIKRWSGGGLSIQSKRTELTREEWQWINKKGQISVAINDGMPPLSFVDSNGNLHGVAADLFQVIGAKVGLDIEVVSLPSTLAQISALDSGNVDLTILSPHSSRHGKYIFSRSFGLDPLVYVISLKNKGKNISELVGNGRVATIEGHLSRVSVKEKYQLNKEVSFPKVKDSLQCVADGKCDVVILPLRVAKFFINADYPMQLFIAGELFNSAQTGTSFAALPKSKILIDILDKILLSIPPDELESLSTRWRVSARQGIVTWQDVLKEFGGVISITLLVLLAGMFWSISLRQQIHQRRLAEAALQGQLKFIEELVDSIPHPIYSRDKDGHITLCNTAYAKFLELEKQDIIGTSDAELITCWPFMSPLIRAFQDTLNSVDVGSSDYHIQTPEGDIDIYHWVQVYRDLDGEVKGAVGGWIDVSERVCLLNELERASQDAQEANRAKSTFLATMSHEIRTPMNAIIGLLELTLRRDRLHEEDKASLSIAHGSANDLLSLIGDILDISKIESGRLELKPEPHDIAALTGSVVTVFSALARQKHLQLELIAGEARWVQIDGLCYKQILSNLISNAIKYTDQGSVRVELQSKTSDGWCTLQLVIRDTGIGIAPAEQARLFQPFGQARQPEHIQRSGTGLGLMISRSLCESMGGSLLLESEPGHGTCISIEMKLPLASAVESVPPVALGSMTGHHRRLRVMIVDDHPTNRLLVSQQLAYLGHDATAAESGSEALALFANTPFDVMITDFNMPGMSGFELTRQYRALELSRGTHRCLILGLTADARQEQVSEGLTAGMDDCLFKPVGLEELERCLGRHMQHEGQQEIEHCMQEIKQSLGPLTGNQPALMQPLLSEFVRASDDDLLGLQQAADDAELARFLDYVHRLKGGAKIMGAMTLVSVCGEIESGGLAPQGLRVALLQLQHAYGIVRQAMVQMQSEPG